jgi:hypothetical protein
VRRANAVNLGPAHDTQGRANWSRLVAAPMSRIG